MSSDIFVKEYTCFVRAGKPRYQIDDMFWNLEDITKTTLAFLFDGLLSPDFHSLQRP